MISDKAPIIVFDDSVKDRVIKSLGLSKNDKSELIDSDNKVITTQEFEPIKESEFGGMLKGSRIPIKNKESEVARYFISLNQ